MQTKTCVQCGEEFAKPSSCSKRSWKTRKLCSRQCADAFKKGKPIPHLKEHQFSKGQKAFNEGIRSGSYTSCPICGDPVYLPPSAHKCPRTCGKLTCKRRYRKEVVNPKIAERARQDYASGKRESVFTRIPGNRDPNGQPASEMHLAALLEPFGWIHWYVVKTNLSRKPGNPLWYRLDFAKPTQKLYVELDGSSHRSKSSQARDQRRDKLLQSLGWKGVRIPEQEFLDKPLDVVVKIQKFVKSSCCYG